MFSSEYKLSSKKKTMKKLKKYINWLLKKKILVNGTKYKKHKGSLQKN